MEKIGDFELVGYCLDYYINGVFSGSLPVKEADRETFGYQGRKAHVLSADIVLRKKVIKAGTPVVTELIPLCGKSTVPHIVIKNEKS